MESAQYLSKKDLRCKVGHKKINESNTKKYMQLI